MLLLIGLLLGLAYTPYVQKILVSNGLQAVFKSDSVDIELGYVHFNFNDRVLIEDLLIRDQHQDTLLFTKQLYAELSDLNFRQGLYQIDSVLLADSKFYLRHYEGDEYGNIRFLLDKFKNEEDDENGSPISILGRQISIRNFEFLWRHYQAEQVGPVMNFENIHVTGFNADISDFSVKDKQVKGSVDQLTLQEHCGFSLDSLQTQVLLHPDYMQFTQIKIHTPYSEIAADYTMHHGQYEFFKEYIYRVKMDATLYHSHVDSRDIAYFTDVLDGLNESVDGTAKFNGTVNHFVASEMDLKVRKNTIIRGKISMDGIPNADSMYMKIYLKEAKVLPTDITDINLQIFTESLDFEIPEFADNYGPATVTASLIGYYHDFKSKGNIYSPNGNIRADLSLKRDADSTLNYVGDLSVESLNLNKLFERNELGNVTAVMLIDGSGTGLEELNMKAEGTVQQFDLFGYNYNNIRIDGLLKNQLFDGEIEVDDENLELDFVGTVDFRYKEPRFLFSAHVDTMYPVALNLLKRDSSVFVRTSLDFDTKGTALKDFAGKAALSNFKYYEGGKWILIPELKVQSYDLNDRRHIEFKSSIAKGMMEGTYYMPEFGKAFRYMVQQTLPALVQEELEIELEHEFSFELELVDVNPVLEIFYPGLQIDPNLTLTGAFNGAQSSIDINLKSSGIEYQEMVMDSIEWNLNHLGNSFNSELAIHSLVLNKNVDYNKLNLTTKAWSDSLYVSLTNDNKSVPNFKSDIEVFGLVNGPSKFQFSFDSSYVVLADSVWTLRNGNSIKIDSTAISIDGFHVQSNHKELGLSGTVSEDSSDVLEVMLKELNLGNMTRISGMSDGEYSGNINGIVYLAKLYTQPELLSNLHVSNLVANDEYIGSGPLVSFWNPELKRFDIDFDLYRPADTLFQDTIRSLRLLGHYYPGEKDTALHLNLRTDGFKIRSIEPLVSEYIDNLSGELAGDIALSGNIKEPVLKGDIRLKDAGFRIPYLNTNYRIYDETIEFKDDWFGVDSLTVHDKHGRKARATGTVFHENWRDFNFDVIMDLDTFLSLNTTEKDNELYYGTAYLNGWVNISSGYQGKIHMEMEAETRNHSKLYLPLYSSNEVYQNDFIRFVNKEENALSVENVEEDEIGIDMNFKFDIDPSTEIQLIFDPSTGEILRAQGGGKIDMLVNPDGDFEMYGIYEVRNGDYLFNFENLFAKRFSLSQGGTISFNGDPLNAGLDVIAQYKVKAGLDKILGDSSYSQKVDNICLMHLTDQLQEPNITFDIDVLNVDADIEAQVKSQMPTQDDVNKQVFSLMLFNDYSPPNNNLSGSGFVGATGSDLITNQINNWLSRMDNNVIDVGVSELKSDNVEVELSKKMLDNRLIFESNIGVDNSNTTNTSSTQNQFVGDFKLEYMVRKDGRVRAKVFNRSETYRIEDQGSSGSQTQGVGIFYQENFESYGQLFRKVFHKKTEEEKEQKQKKKEQKKAARKDD